ncbi:chemotaxis response regulator protein-glutamate methylesterase [Planktothrix sp. FACHB-1355]|uniref:Protein-glutamate methylesterase/protein-glutamine glutaminase n=1 Tax=Aerosakkonema funiforme FACHB-1375 TaxID=2949571 RepID=A0A926ZHP6_9CYAN|nr:MULTISPECIES: chemotaxis response regulator protein-glutamate methylesterase [Oscillatoriales]MBD2182407.1 chemotaxis response regulator protein-glutamate methylesterase [Aerosakkonema funiforme FACHB-1375]MBD3558281.1 chemotaxis response regulator protein-glutamate methylesterase [Planktothrix sp. FACHB-1355]
MKIAIVNDMIMAVEAIRRVLLAVPEYEVVWVARDGAEAVAKCAKDTPDLVLMDLIMPVMDGVEATSQIMKNSPCAILVVTASVGKNSGKVFEAMGHGALDAVKTPVLGMSGTAEGSQPLLSKIATIKKLIGKSTPISRNKTNSLNIRTNFPPLVAIGSSTGGPKVLATILSRLPASLNAAVAIVQHVDVQFSSGLVEWLNQQSALPVMLASRGDRLEAGKVIVAGTNDHMILTSNLTLSYTKEPQDYPYRPSVDVFFESLAEHWQRKATAVLLTGMGRDGAEGLCLLRSKGWHTIAQNKDSCVVYGMPKAAAELNAAVEILPPEAIASSLIDRLTYYR